MSQENQNSANELQDLIDRVRRWGIENTGNEPSVSCFHRALDELVAFFDPGQQKVEQVSGSDEPVGEVTLFGETLKEISWKIGKLPPVGAKLYLHPSPNKADVRWQPIKTAPKSRLLVLSVPHENGYQYMVGGNFDGDWVTSTNEEMHEPDFWIPFSPLQPLKDE